MQENTEDFKFFPQPRIIEFKSEHSHLDSVEFIGDYVHLKIRDGETLSFSEKDKPEFKTETGEKVIEFCGKATNNVEEKSWAIVYLTPGGYSPKHHHSQRTEIYYITGGSAKVVIDDSEYYLERGDTIVIEPMQKHQIFNTGDKNLELLVECTPAWVYQDHLIDNEDMSKPLGL